VILVTCLVTGARAQEAAVGDLEARMVARLNRDREAHALPALAASAVLAEVARGHSRDMVEGGFFAHVSPRNGVLRDRLRGAGIRYAKAGENIAQDLSLEGAANSLLASPSHRVNILSSDFTHVGVGIVRKGPWIYVTQNFMRVPVPRRPVRSAPEVPAGPVRAEFLGGALRGY
jgi:uncharacterized protein YkwD